MDHSPDTSPVFDIPILCYHYVEPVGVTCDPYSISINLLEQHLDLLAARGFTTIGFADLYQSLRTKIRPPHKSVIITFDDGGKCFHERAMPMLLARRMTATVFIVAGEIGGINRWDVANGAAVRTLMSDSDIRDLVSHNIELGSHGWSHRAIPDCSTHDLQRELGDSRQELESRFGQPITTLAYPYGRYRDDHHQALKTFGYEGAVSIFSPYPTVISNRYAMRRIAIHNGDTILRLRMKLAPPYLRWCAFRDRNARRDL